MLIKLRPKAQVTLEYMVVFLFILGAFLVFQKYIVRAINGRWKSVGDTFGEGQIYDPKKTVECAVDTRFPEHWYEVDCFEDNCKSTCFGVNYHENNCRDCIITCSTAEGGICIE